MTLHMHESGIILAIAPIANSWIPRGDPRLFALAPLFSFSDYGRESAFQRRGTSRGTHAGSVCFIAFGAKNGRPFAYVIAIFTAKAITAVSSSVAETGNTFHAIVEKPSYASGSELTRSVHPHSSSSSAISMSRLL